MKSVVLILIFTAFSAQALEIAALPAPSSTAPMSVPTAPAQKVNSSQVKPKPAGHTQASAAEDCKDEVPHKPSLDESFCTVDELNQKTEKR